jgi:hypothetical protein
MSTQQFKWSVRYWKGNPANPHTPIRWEVDGNEITKKITCREAAEVRDALVSAVFMKYGRIGANVKAEDGTVYDFPIPRSTVFYRSVTYQLAREGLPWADWGVVWIVKTPSIGVPNFISTVEEILQQ